MKALTLHQPWASLVALGVKTIETRSWSTKYRGPIAIHAGKAGPKGLCPAELNASLHAAFDWPTGGFEPTAAWPIQCWSLPAGGVVATATLVDILPIVEPSTHVMGQAHVGWSRHTPDRLGLWRPTTEPHNVAGVHSAIEYHAAWAHEDVTDRRPFGDFTPGRYAWLLDDIVPLAEPIPARGRQGLWTWEAP